MSWSRAERGGAEGGRGGWEWGRWCDVTDNAVPPLNFRGGVQR